MATNDIYSNIVKRIFQGNNGTQFQLLRQKLEVLEFQLSGVEPNTEQQEYIDKVNALYLHYDSEINKYLGTTALKDIGGQEQ